jgi:hypothetical protein
MASVVSLRVSWAASAGEVRLLYRRAFDSGLFRSFDDDGMALDHALDPHEQYSVSVSEAPE